MLLEIFDHYLFKTAVVLFFLIMVPVLLTRGRGVRDASRPDRRKRPRPGVDRRA